MIEFDLPEIDDVDVTKLGLQERFIRTNQAKNRIKELDTTMSSMLQLIIAEKKAQVRLIRRLCSHNTVTKRDVTGKRRGKVYAGRLIQCTCSTCGIRAYSDDEDLTLYKKLDSKCPESRILKSDCKHDNVFKDKIVNKSGKFLRFRCTTCGILASSALDSLVNNTRYKVLEALYDKQQKARDKNLDKVTIPTKIPKPCKHDGIVKEEATSLTGERAYFMYTCPHCNLVGKPSPNNDKHATYEMLADLYYGQNSEVSEVTEPTKTSNDCNHNNVSRRSNGFWDMYTCQDCNESATNMHNISNRDANTLYMELKKKHEAGYSTWSKHKDISTHRGSDTCRHNKISKVAKDEWTIYECLECWKKASSEDALRNTSDKELYLELERRYKALMANPGDPSKVNPDIRVLGNNNILGTFECSISKTGDIKIHPSIRYLLHMDSTEVLKAVIKTDGTITLNKLNLKGSEDNA